MKAKEYVLKYLPNAMIDVDFHRFRLWANKISASRADIVSEGYNENKAWRNAYKWLKKLTDQQREELCNKYK